MFGVVYLVCGIPGINPFVVDGCGIIAGKVPFRTKEECIARLEQDTELIESKLREGVYIADKICYKVNKEI